MLSSLLLGAVLAIPKPYTLQPCAHVLVTAKEQWVWPLESPWDAPQPPLTVYYLDPKPSDFAVMLSPVEEECLDFEHVFIGASELMPGESRVDYTR